MAHHTPLTDRDPGDENDAWPSLDAMTALLRASPRLPPTVADLFVKAAARDRARDRAQRTRLLSGVVFGLGLGLGLVAIRNRRQRSVGEAVIRSTVQSAADRLPLSLRGLANVSVEGIRAVETAHDGTVASVGAGWMGA